ncbi:hypothetical protein BU25DRAFT_446165 [Macroventuria anomochaeta]|uniref:Uncharacterized protein n=1 Tax=Macroventuria anomochaeta TaxID=301207 RepID=A0ACB6SDV7_9PLEO|nr:uncharacterized protein BU25DRAFT_446165 [Macroventuria anomochaeta]KAF2631282.1 hypothetical protein BU25DRAFT_446165 [Macroventuria anomochaeta]
MADSSLNELNYGRPGLTTYDLDNREWNTSRHLTTKTLKQVSEWQLAVPAAIDSLPTGTSTNATTARKDAKQLVHNHPSLVPATKQLPELNAVSDAVTSAARTYDPCVSDLLSFGTVYLKKFVRPKRIAALPTGPSGSILRLVLLGRQKQGWNGDNSVWLSGPSFKTVDSGYWNEEASPIQQVCFAQDESSNSFLAVRLPSRTVLFRPSYHRGRRAAEPSPHYVLPPSLLSARPISNITLEQTGDAPHADVAFNPDYQFQFGIVDQQCKWSLWQIERRAKKDEYNVSRLFGGDVLHESDITDDGDGWARISWAGDSNTLLVCNRRQFSVVSLNGQSFEYLQGPRIIPQRSTDWILDLQRHPQYQNRFFVLTSSRLFLVAVTTSNAAVDSTADQAGATILLSRRHYRGDEDLTLRLSVQTLVDDETCIFLTSRLNGLIQVYYLRDHSSESPALVTISDPIALDFESPAATHISQMYLQLLEYGTKVVPHHRPSNASAQSYLKRAIPFYQLTLVLADLSVYQAVLLSSEHDPDPEPIVWRRIVVAKHSLDALTEADEMNAFVEPNGPDWDAEPEPKLGSQLPRPVSSSDRPPAQASMDQTATYDALLHGDQTNSTCVEVLIEQLRAMMSVDQISPDSRQIMESNDCAVDVPDIDEASSRIDQLFANTDPEISHLLRRIAPVHVLHLLDSEWPSISALYDAILQEWIAPLPAEIPVPVRHAKERLARRVAAEVSLASVQLRPKEEEQPNVGSGDPMPLPILPSKPANMFPSSLPTPPQSSVPPSSPLLPEYLRPPTRDPLSRLRRHLTINDESSMMPTILPPSVSELLSHWHPGTDPSTYDWEATERALRPEMPDEKSQELRERERKKKERREKRQRREDELMRAKSQTNSQSVFSQPAFPRSSPGPTFGGMAASSQVPVPTSSQMPSQVQSQGGSFEGFGGVHSMVPQSQVEPGRFGGRPDKKKKKGKSRVSGF